jgi:hypothetical protein
MARCLFLTLLASIAAAALANAQDAVGKISPDQIRPDIARAFKRKPEGMPPTGFVFLDSVIAFEPDTFPPKGIELQHLSLGRCPLVRLTVPVERVAEVKALLQSLAPPRTGWCGWGAKF